MKKLIKLKCTSCNANLSIDGKRDFLFCEYCGTILIIDNENEYIHRYIDDADVKRAETEQLVKLKELEIEEKKAEQCKQVFKYLLLFSMFIFLYPLIVYIIKIINSLIPWSLGLLFLYFLGKKFGIVKKTNKNDL